MEENTCKQCANFVRHYVAYKDGFLPIRWGHCSYCLDKAYPAYTPACENFEKNEDK